MKRLLAFPAVLVVGIVVGIVVGRVSSRAPAFAGAGGAGEPPAMPCADLNKDGGVNITDAVYLLSCLFAGGPCPECSPPVSAFPTTNQTECYDTRGNMIDCESTQWPGQDGFHKHGCSPERRFVDNGDGTVTDTCTALMWQKATVRDAYTWQQALQHCEDLGLADYDDWRLPNVKELQSIVDYGRSDPAIDPVFDSLPESWWWSSTTAALAPSSAWIVGFHEGFVGNTPKGNVRYVRAVRAIQPGEPELE
jgi:hypothetical protein